MLIIGHMLHAPHPAPLRFYAEVREDDRSTPLLSTVPCASPSAALALGRELRDEHVVWGGEDSCFAVKAAA